MRGSDEAHINCRIYSGRPEINSRSLVLCLNSSLVTSGWCEGRGKNYQNPAATFGFRAAAVTEAMNLWPLPCLKKWTRENVF
jgi:hypothetical protein